MAFSSLGFITCAVLVCSYSAHGSSSIGPSDQRDASKTESSPEKETGSTPPTTQPPAATTPQLCLDNYNGEDCVCQPGQTGRGCRFYLDFVPATLKRSVQVKASLSWRYDPSYSNTASQGYQDVVLAFTTEMMSYYGGQIGTVPNLIGVTVTSISQGLALPEGAAVVKLSKEGIKPRADGMNVTYQLILRFPNNNMSEQTYDDNFKAVQDTNEELLVCSECSFTHIDSSTKMPLTSTDVCGIDYHYYEKLYQCVTVCSPFHKNPQPCYNGGNCTFHRELGRICDCQHPSSTLYLSNDCQFPILIMGLIVGLSVTLLILLVAIAFLTARVVNNKRKKSKKENMTEKLVNQWTNDDVTRPGSAVFSIGGSGRQTASPYQMSRPFSADSARLTQTGSPFPNRGLSQSAPPARPLSQPMRINRPEIRGQRDA